MRNLLASLGMWLTRRFGSVRPGDGSETTEPMWSSGLFDPPSHADEQFQIHPDSEGRISPEEGAALFQRLAKLRSMGITEKHVYEDVVRRAIVPQAEKSGEAKPARPNQ